MKNTFVAGKISDPDQLVESAMFAGMRAANAVTPVPFAHTIDGGKQMVERGGICGSAAVTVHPGSDFYDTIRALLGGRDGAVKLLPPPEQCGQSYEKSAAWAHAVVAVLIPAGVRAEARVWID